VECSCCGQERDTLVTLGSRDDVQLCPVCINWLVHRVGVVSTPTLPVQRIADAQRFFERAGFDVHVYEGGGFAFVERDGQSVFDLDEITDLDVDANHAGCYIVTHDVDDWHAHLVAAGLPVTEVHDEPWGMHEFTLTDPFHNNIRIGQSTPTDGEAD
jgi:hypothetical protein